MVLASFLARRSGIRVADRYNESAEAEQERFAALVCGSMGFGQFLSAQRAAAAITSPLFRFACPYLFGGPRPMRLFTRSFPLVSLLAAAVFGCTQGTAPPSHSASPAAVNPSEAQVLLKVEGMH
jgi:hypothetical protein